VTLIKNIKDKIHTELNTIWGGHLGGSIERWTLDFGSGHDFRVVRSSPASGSVLGVESA